MTGGGDCDEAARSSQTSTINLVAAAAAAQPSLVGCSKRLIEMQQKNNIMSLLKENQSLILAIRMKEDLFSLKGFRSPTLRGLRSILEDYVPTMNCLENIEMVGGMFIENDHDVKILSKCLRNHHHDKSLLRSMKILDFQSYAIEKTDSGPLLDPLVNVLSSIPNLQEFQLRCRASYKIWKQSYISINAIRPLCQSIRLQKLELSNLGLTDDHLQAIAHGLSANPNSILTELTLNNNRNGDAGIQAVIGKLLHKESKLEKLEVYNTTRPSVTTSELLLKELDRNHTIKQLSVNARYQDKANIDFFLLLNRTGRRALLNPRTNPEDAIAILDDARDDISLLFYFLIQNPSLCNITRQRSSTFSKTFTTGRYFEGGS
jgi:hypothetical protein